LVSALLPPQYPTSVFIIPSSLLNLISGPQKHPNPKIISYENIIKFFYEIHDPTTLNSQGPDFGTQYRSEIFYLSDGQKEIAENVIEKINSSLSGQVVTKSSLLKNYCPAEEYHQRYLEKR